MVPVLLIVNVGVMLLPYAFVKLLAAPHVKVGLMAVAYADMIRALAALNTVLMYD